MCGLIIERLTQILIIYFIEKLITKNTNNKNTTIKETPLNSKLQFLL